MRDCGSFAVIEGQGSSKNLQGRGNQADPSSFQYQNNGDCTKNKASKGTFWALGFLCGGGGLSLWGRNHDIWVLIPEPSLIFCLNSSSNVALLALQAWMGQPNE